MKFRYLIAITGADGSGKSSLIKALAAEPLRNVKIASIYYNTRNKSNSKEGKPYGEHLPPRPVTISILKLLWAGLRWLFEFFFFHAPQIWGGNIVLLDRFYLDELLLTPRKYRYNAPSKITRFVRNILPRPGLYILLDAHEEVLYARKQDQTIDQLRQYRQRYLNWIKKQSSYRVLEASLPLNEIAAQTRAIIESWAGKPE